MTDYAFPASKFTLPGDPGRVRETAGAYGRFATAAGEGAGGLRGLQVSSWLGTEGDIYRDGVSQLPPQLDTAHGSYSQVATALNGFAEVLDREQRAIGVIRTYAESDWQALRDARAQRAGLKKPSDDDKNKDPNAQANFDTLKGGLDRRVNYLEGQWKLRVDAASSARGRVDEAARAAGHQIRAAGRASPTADQNWFEDKWEKTKRAVGDAIDGLKNFLKDHAGFFRGLAKVLRVVGYLLMVVGALTTVFFGVGGALMLIGGGLVAAGDILDKSVDWAEGKISGWDLLKSAGISILTNVGLGVAGKLALPLAARFAGPLLSKAAPLLSKAAPFMNKMADLGNKLKITPALGKFDNMVDSAVNKVVPGWMNLVNKVTFPGRSPGGSAVPGVTNLADDVDNVNLGPGATHVNDGPTASQFDNGPGATQFDNGPGASQFDNGPGTANVNNGPGVTHVNDGPGASQFDNGPGATHVDDGPGATQLDNGPGTTHVDDGPGTTNVNAGPAATHVNDGPGTTNANDGPGATHADDSPGASNADDGPGTTHADDGPGTTHHDDGPGTHQANDGPGGHDGGNAPDKPFDPHEEYSFEDSIRTFPEADHYRAGPYKPGEAPPPGQRPDIYEGARDFPDKASADAYGKAVWDEPARALPPDLRDAASRYFGTRSEAIPLNAHLRGQNPQLPHGTTPADYDHLANQMDEFLASNPVPEDLVVYRSMAIEHAFPGGIDNLVGSTHVEPGFMSTALGKVHFSTKDAVVKLRVPAGTPGMYVRPITAPVMFDEQEMILGRGLSYTIHNVQDLGNGRYLIEAEILPPAP